MFAQRPHRPRPCSQTRFQRFQIRFQTRPGTVARVGRSALLVAVTLLGLALPSAPAPAAAAVTNQHLVVPFYFPYWQSQIWDGALDQALAGDPTVGQLVLNPNSGPGSTTLAAFSDAITRGNQAGVKTIGYVFTKYGDQTQRPQSAVEADIDTWYQLYGSGLDGIFFDEASNSCAKAGYYAALTSYVKTNHPGATVVDNQGIYPPDCFQGGADIFITFEGSYASYLNYSVPADSQYDWLTDPANADHFEHLVYSADPGQLANAVTLSKQRNAGWLYVTPRSYANNPWAAMPEGSYWFTEVDAVAGVPTRLCLSSWWAGSTGDTLSYGLSSTAGTGSFARVYLDADRNTGTGFTGVAGLGADYLIENGNLYKSSANGSGWNWGTGPIATVTPTVSALATRWTVPRSAFTGVPVSSAGANVGFEAQSGAVIATSPVHSQAGDAGGQVNDDAVGFDASTVTYRARFDASFVNRHVYLDVDGNAGTGFAVGGLGADYLIENSTLYHHTGTGWSWTSVGTATPTTSGDLYTWRLSRSPYNSGLQGSYQNPFFDPVSTGTERVVFGANHNLGDADVLSPTRTVSVGGYALG